MNRRNLFLLIPPVSLVLIALIAAVCLFTVRSNVGISQEFTNDQRTIGNVKDLSREIVDMQSGKRGFQLTGQDSFLQPYTEAIPRFNALLAETKGLVLDEPDRIAALDRVDKVMTRWVAEIAAPGIEKRREVDKGTAAIGEIELMMKTQDGGELTARANQELNGVIAAEQQEIDDRQAAFVRNWTLLSVLAGLAFALAIISIASLVAQA